MAKIKPFKGLRPKPELAEQVATLPYDVVNVEEARQIAQSPKNFYHVTRSEIDMPEGIDVHSSAVYEKAKENIGHFISSGILEYDEKPCYYIYELEMNGRSKTGLVCGSSIEDYNNGIIKKHEYTRPEKEQDRINHIKTTGVQTGVVFLAYHDEPHVQSIIENWKKDHTPANNFIAEDGIRHTFWVVDDEAKIESITEHFDQHVGATYIADGHHRAASAAKVAETMKAEGKTTEMSNYFITCIFPATQVEIQDYNRVVKDLNGMSEAEFLEKIKEKFEVEHLGKTAFKPTVRHQFGMYMGGQWYRLTARPGTYSTDQIGVLDVSVVQKNILSEILEIHDPRTDKRVDFVGGIRGMVELEKRVNSGECAAAFSIHPVSIEQLFAVSDCGHVMPPKSTWFEPKLRDGLVAFPI